MLSEQGTVKWERPGFGRGVLFHLYIDYSRLDETIRPLDGRLFSGAKGLFLFDLRVELRIGSC